MKKHAKKKYLVLSIYVSGLAISSIIILLNLIYGIFSFILYLSFIIVWKLRNSRILSRNAVIPVEDYISRAGRLPSSNALHDRHTPILNDSHHHSVHYNIESPMNYKVFFPNGNSYLKIKSLGILECTCKDLYNSMNT